VSFSYLIDDIISVCDDITMKKVIEINHSQNVFEICRTVRLYVFAFFFFIVICIQVIYMEENHYRGFEKTKTLIPHDQKTQIA